MASGVEGKSWQLRWLAFATLLLCTSFLTMDSAEAEPRLALLISNQAYADAVGPLRNPHNDIALIKTTLLQIGFAEADIQVVADADRVAMLQAFDAFATRLRRAGPEAVSFFYYSGHGAANDRRENFLIPVDVQELTSTGFWYRSVPLRDLLDRLNAEAPEARHFIVFDACRNTLKLREPDSRALVQPKGFQPVANIPGGMLIAFSTAEGELASDVGERAGPYATFLAEEIVKPGLEAITVFRNVQLSVSARLKQKPWTQNGPIGETYFAGRAPQPPLSEAAQAWQPVQNTESESVLEDFIRRHGDTIYGNIARAKLAELRATVTIRIPITTCQSPNVWVTLAGRGGKCVKPGGGKDERESFKDCPACPEMVVAPAGEFLMGSPDDESKRERTESPQRKVTINQPVAIGKYAVTQDEFEAFVADSGRKMDGGCYRWADGRWKLDAASFWGSPGFTQTGTHPIVCINWDDAEAYQAWLSKKTGKTYRLLSEAEREYVARAGTMTPFWWGASITPGQANYDGDTVYKGGGKKGEYRHRTVAVKSFQPNAWGLYQVHGNVWEWVQDCWNENYEGAPTDGSAWKTGDCGRRVLRGGSWLSSPASLRAASRISDGGRHNYYGFRLARTLNP